MHQIGCQLMAPLSERLCVQPADLFSSSQKLVIYHYLRWPWEWFRQTSPAYRLGAQCKQHTAGQTRVMMTITPQGMWIKTKMYCLCSSLSLRGRLCRQWYIFDHLDFQIFLPTKVNKKINSLFLFSAVMLWSKFTPRMSVWFKQTVENSLVLWECEQEHWNLALQQIATPGLWKFKSVCYSKLNVLQFVWNKNSQKTKPLRALRIETPYGQQVTTDYKMIGYRR